MALAIKYFPILDQSSFATAKPCCLIDYNREMLVVDLLIVFKQQLKFASNFCPCAMMVNNLFNIPFFNKGPIFLSHVGHWQRINFINMHC